MRPLAPAGPAIGPFRLLEPLARGGSAEVWRGEHEHHGVPVAVKLLTAESARGAQAVAAFRHEAQMVAGLDHPNIILLLDYGQLGAAAAAASDGRLPPGCPYLVMELQERGSLAAVCGRIGWSEARRILACLLGALAHAHARRVLHGDVKPGNVLLEAEGDLRPGIKLTDFGIARAIEAPGTGRMQRPGTTPAGDLVGGTPHYMAPEQLEGTVRELGPWTNLYALGCTAYAMLTGRPPFPHREYWRVKAAHLRDPPPPLAEHVGVPSDFAGWLRRLLEKRPRDRFQRAADAAFALAALPAEGPSAAGGAGARRGRRAPSAATEPPRRPPRETPAPESPTCADPSISPAPPPPLPLTWRIEAEAPASPRLLGAGLGLYGLRSIRMVGREGERDVLWEELLRAGSEGRARLVLLHGASGVGKSRLAEWLTERAHECGGAHVLRVARGPFSAAGDGLIRMLALELRTAGLARGEASAAVERDLRARGETDPYQWNALAALLTPAAPKDGGERAEATPGERHALIRRHLARLGRERPLLLWIDDVERASAELGFCRELLESRETAPLPLLVLLTVRDEALAERPIEAAQIEELLALPGARRLEVEPLPRPAWPALVRELLGLRGALAAEVEERAAGNPLFAVQLVGHWVERGLLEATGAGFALHAGETAGLPRDLHQVWSERIDRLLNRRGPGEGLALELAATLGDEVDDEEWSAACTEAGALAPEGLVQALLRGRLARPVEHGWRFAHGMLRESICRRTEEAGHAAALHRRCADMLRARAGRRPGLEERLGRHLLAAGELEDALAPLLLAADERRSKGDLRTGLALIELREGALTALAEPPVSHRAAEGWLLRARLHIQEGDLAAALAAAERARGAAAARGWSGLQARAALALATPHWRKGELARAGELLEEALALFTAVDDRRGRCEGLVKLGRLMLDRGDAAAAEARLEEARAVGPEELLPDCLRGLAKLAMNRGDLARARELCEQARALDERAGSGPKLVMDLMLLAVIAGMEGALDEAETGYRNVLAIAADHGQPALARDARLSLALVQIERGRHGEADRELGLAEETLRRDRDPVGLLVVHAARLACAAAAGDPLASDRHLEGALSLAAETGFAEFSVAWSAEKAGEQLRERGDRARAARAYAFAFVQWRALGREQRAQAAEEACRLLA